MCIAYRKWSLLPTYTVLSAPMYTVPSTTVGVHSGRPMGASSAGCRGPRSGKDPFHLAMTPVARTARRRKVPGEGLRPLTVGEQGSNPVSARDGSGK